MAIKCNFNIYNNYPPLVHHGSRRVKMPKLKQVCDNVQNIEKRPVADRNATGRLSFIRKFKTYFATYKKNIKHTYDHKVIFALIEKELFNKNSIDSITHDLDKLVLYTLGFPKSFVSKFHRKHSEHHTESHKKMNLKSMVCDNIASSPFFKPEKKFSVRDHFNNSAELQQINGLKELLEKYNYGEKLNHEEIKNKKAAPYYGINGAMKGLARSFTFMF